MFTFMFKFVLFFTVSFLILNIPIGNKKMFYVLDKYTAPWTQGLGKNIKGTTDLGKQLFINSNPRHSIYNDLISKKQSAILKERKKQIHDTEEEISVSDQAVLSDLIESSSKK